MGPKELIKYMYTRSAWCELMGLLCIVTSLSFEAFSLYHCHLMAHGASHMMTVYVYVDACLW